MAGIHGQSCCKEVLNLNPAVIRHSNVDTGTSTASDSRISCSMYNQYTCAEIRVPPCICTCLNVLGARTTAGFRLKKRKGAGKLGRSCSRPSSIRMYPACGRVAQLDRVSASEAEGRGFESRLAHQFYTTNT